MKFFVGLFLLLMCSCTSRLDEEEWERARKAMVERLEAEGIADSGILKTMAKVERHHFLPSIQETHAYQDRAQMLPFDQTLSAPYMTARLLEIVNPRPYEKVLEIRTGAGYLTALLAELSKEVYTLEIVRPTAQEAKRRLDEKKYSNIYYKVGSLHDGWPEKGPYDVIVATAAIDYFPQDLIDQLAAGGRMVIPIGDLEQTLMLITKDEVGTVQKKMGRVRFMAMLRDQDLSPEQRGDKNKKE